VKYVPQFESLNEAQRWIFEELLRGGRPVSPRGSETIELPPTQIALICPRRRLLTMAARKWSLPLAIGEFCWHLSGSDDVEALEFYAPRWRNFADDHRKINGSCYGNRIFRSDVSGVSQWTSAMKLLRADHASRRAVLLTAQPLGLEALRSNDVACTSLIQLLVRNDHLDVVVFMRSNDAFWGFPYDVFLFTMLQEMAAVELGLEMGTYYHVVGSLHLYRNHISVAEQLVGEGFDDTEMPQLRDLEFLEKFLMFERLVRTNFAESLPILLSLPSYWRHLGEVIYNFVLRKRGAGERMALSSELSPYRELGQRKP
jgi:thymidylate synthase